jgi:hypothetical protein
MTEEDKNHNRHDASQTTTAGPREQLQRQQSVMRIAAAIAVPALAALAIVFVLGVGNNTEQAFAPPGAPCPNCATQIEGSGFGTITLPEGAEIFPVPCAACSASISFNATTLPDTKKHEATGTLTITYTDAEAVEHSITGDITRGEIKPGNSFKLEGIHPPFCALCDFVLKGTIQKGTTTDTADIVFKAADGTTATFDNAKVTISTIPTET